MKIITGVLFGVMLCAPSARAANIVFNPGFESPLLTPWIVDPGGNWFIDSISHTGNNDISTGCAGSACLTNAFFYQDLSTVIGQKYDLSFWAFFEGPPDEIKVTWGGTVAVDIVNPAVTDDVYTQFSAFDLLATSSTTRLQFLGRQDLGFNGVDDISVTQAVPEPSTLVLIGSGFLIVAGRRLQLLIRRRAARLPSLGKQAV